MTRAAAGMEPATLILVEMGCYSLSLRVEPGADLDGRFRAVCCDTGETLMVNGWLADSIIVERGAESGPADRPEGHEPASP